MTDLWIFDGTSWIRTVPSISTSTGYVPASRVYIRPTTTTWNAIWLRDQTPPPPPTLTASFVTGTRNVFSIKLTMPTAAGGAGSKKFLRAVVKVGINKTPTGPTTNDGCFYSETTGVGGEQWSNFLTSSLTADNTIEQGQTQTKQFPATYQNITLPLNTKINFVAWVQDTSLNWSPAATVSVTTKKSTDLPAGTSLFTTVIYASAVDTWDSLNKVWLYKSGSKSTKTWLQSKTTTPPHFYYWQGGNHAMLTYLSFGSVVRQLFNSALEIRSVTLPLSRRNYDGPNDHAAASGPPNNIIFRLQGLKAQTLPAAGSTSDLLGTAWEQKSTAVLGAYTTLNIPASLYNQFIDGKGSSYGFGFYAVNAAGADTADPRNISFGISSKQVGVVKDYAGNSGMLTVQWVGLTNPWPKATPGVSGYKPLNHP